MTKDGNQPRPPPPAQAKRKKFHHPLSIPDSQWTYSQWNISEEQMILSADRQPPPTTCTAEGGKGGLWEADDDGHSEGIKVVHETIIRSAEKGEQEQV